MAGLFQEKTSQKIYLVVKDLFLIELFFVGQRVEQFLREISFTSLPGELNVNHQRRWKENTKLINLEALSNFTDIFNPDQCSEW